MQSSFGRAVEVEKRSRRDIESDQTAKLLEMVSVAYEESDFIRNRWARAGVRPGDVQTLADFRERAPFVDKDLLMAYSSEQPSKRGLLWSQSPDVYGWATTSGTTGDPAGVPLSRRGEFDSRELYRSGYIRLFHSMGVTEGDLVSVLFFTFRGPISADLVRAGGRPIYFDHSPRDLERFCRWSLEMRPKALYFLSTPMVIALRDLEKGGVDLIDVFGSYRGICWGGEPLGDRARQDVDRWGIELYDHAALADISLAAECHVHDGCHVPEDDVIVECLDPETDEPVADGAVGELVVTSLDPGIPLLRSRSADLVQMSRSRCDCGRTHARIWTRGRKSDEIVIDGESILPIDIWRAVESIDETSAGLFQIIRTARRMTDLRLRIGFRPGSRSRAALAEELRSAVQQETGVDPTVELVPNDDLLRLGPPHKIPRVVQS